MINRQSDEEEVMYAQGKRQIVYLSVSFLVLFTAFSSTQNIIGVLFKEQGYASLGFTSLIVLYFAFAISTLFINKVVKRYSYKWIFMLSSVGYTLLNISGIWVTVCKGEESTGVCSIQLIYLVTYIFSAICGVSASSIWVAQGVYIDQVSSSIPQFKGALYGLFWSIFLVNNIISCIISAVIINFRKPLDFFIATSVLGLLSTIFFSFIPQPNRNMNTQHSEIEEKEQEVNLSKRESLSKIYSLIFSKKTRSLMLFTFFSGVIMSFCSGFLSQLVENSINQDPLKHETGSQKLTQVCLCLGIFEVLSGVVSHKLSDKIPVYKLASISSFVSLCATMLSFVGLVSHSFFFCFLIGATWGFSDGLFENLMTIISSKRFGGTVSIFQSTIFVQNIGFCFSQLLFTMLESSPSYIYLMFVNIIALITNLSLQFNHQSEDETPGHKYAKLNSDYQLLYENQDIAQKETDDDSL